jgi:hypothetical protein
MSRYELLPAGMSGIAVLVEKEDENRGRNKREDGWREEALACRVSGRRARQ